MFYALGLWLPAASWFLMWLCATRGGRLVDHRLDPGYLRRMTIQYGGSVALYSSAILLSLIDFKWGLGLCVGLTLLYLLPPRRPRYVDDDPRSRAAERPEPLTPGSATAVDRKP